MHLKVTEDGVFTGFANYAAGLGPTGVKIGVDALNKLGKVARQETIKAEARTTGLSTRVLGRALHETRATATAPAYEIVSSGGEISLKYFAPTETREGVSAKVFGARQVFPGTFMKAGGFSKGRVNVRSWNGQVFRRTGSITSGFRPNSRRHMDQFAKVKSGVVIPREMIQGEPLAAFEFVSAQFPGFVLRRLSAAQLAIRDGSGKAELFGRARIYQG